MLLLAATSAVLGFYLFALVSVLLLVAFLVVELGLLLVLLRFGLAGMMANVMQAHIDVLRVFFRSFWLESGSDFNLPLQPDDAPGLFAIVERLCGRLALLPPKEISLKTDVTAWVRLHGVTRGSRNTVLGIGYDLLAGLTEREIEAVVAHELVHAKLVRRGFHNLSASGVTRVGALAGSLSAVVAGYRKANRDMMVGGAMLAVADWLARNSSKLFAACSRQDEFDADIGAARLCGAAAIGSSLKKLDALSRISSRVPWHERVARLQSGAGYGRWLVAELSASNSLAPSDETSLFASKYSTHPSLRDRLAALPQDASVVSPASDRPAVEMLLADPDQVAAKLVEEIHRFQVELEAKDTQSLLKWNKKHRGIGVATGVQTFAVAWLIVSLIVGLSVGFQNEFSGNTVMATVLCLAAGLAMLWYGKPKDEAPLPVPQFGVFLSAKRTFAEGVDLKAEEARLEKQILESLPPDGSMTVRARALGEKAFEALRACDYLAAHVAARLSLKERENYPTGLVALTVSSAAFGQVEQVRIQMHQLHRATRMGTPSSKWAAAWALLLLGDWATAESFLDDVVKRSPWDPSLRAMMAHCQARRGKYQSAVANARFAVEKDPGSIEILKLLIDVLLASGHVLEAGERLARVKSLADRDEQLAMALARVNLLSQDFGEAERWSQILRGKPAAPHILVQLAQAHERSRRDDAAVTIYGEALRVGFFPEALLGLGRIEAFKQQKAEARRHFLEALDMVRPIGEKASSVVSIAREVLAELVALSEPVPSAKVWTATMPPNTTPSDLANSVFVVCGMTKEDAETRLDEVIKAARPGQPPLLGSRVVWELSPSERQPDGPVRPGVHAVY